MSYTTNTEVLKEAGLQYNTYIISADVDKYRTEAYAIIRSYISGRYNLSSFVLNFSGSDAESILKRIEELMAAGFLLTKEYGTNDVPNDEDGINKITRAEEMLKMIQDGKIKLLDTNGTEFSTDAGNLKSILPATGVEYYETVNDAGDAMNRKFTIGDIY